VHYKDVCDAILKTNGIMVKDLEGHSIFKAHSKNLEAERNKMKQRKEEKANSPSPQKKFQILNRAGPSSKASTVAHTVQNRLKSGQHYEMLKNQA